MNDQLILWFFKGVNFIVMIGIIAYVCRKYIQPFVQKDYYAEQQYLKHLAIVSQTLKEEAESEEEGRGYDDQERDRLKRNVEHWHQSIQEHARLARQRRDEYITHMYVQLKKQLAAISYLHTMKEIKNEALHEVRDRLMKEYAVPEKQRKVMDVIIGRLHE